VDEHDAEAPVDVIVLPASTIVPSCTHMILGSGFARRNGLEIQTIWLPERHAGELDVATTFDVARSARIYKTLDLALLDDPGRRRLALSVYPDDVPLDNAAAQAIGRGALPILGPSSALADGEAPVAGLAVTYWEDAAAIAETITWAASHFSELVGGYERFRETRLQTSRTALAAIAGQSR
jgi:hypothetical protein